MGRVSARYMQYLSAVVATLLVASASMHYSWTSPVIPKISAGQSPLDPNTSQEAISWMVSICSLGCIPGTIFSAWFMDKFGRKTTLLIAGVTMFVPWFILAFAKSMLLVCVARFISGLGAAAAYSVTPFYTGEIAEKDIRGKLASIISVLSLSGELFVLVVGPYVSYLVLAMGCSVLPLVFMVVFYFMPESPYYLVKEAKFENAKLSLKQLTGHTDDAILKTCMDEIANEIQEGSRNKTTLWECISEKKYRRSLIIGFGLKTLLILNGAVAFIPYMQTIIDSSQSSISPELTSVIIGALQLPMALISANIVDKMGRKPLLIFSCLGCAVALIGEGIYFYMQDVLHTDVTFVSWLPTSGLLLYFIVKPLGISTVSFVVFSELFATSIKRYILLFGGLYTTALSFIVTKNYDAASAALGRYVSFWFFALVCIVGALFIYFLLPETKGKTFSEIQEKLYPTSVQAKSGG